MKIKRIGEFSVEINGEKYYLGSSSPHCAEQFVDILCGMSSNGKTGLGYNIEGLGRGFFDCGIKQVPWIRGTIGHSSLPIGPKNMKFYIQFVIPCLSTEEQIEMWHHIATFNKLRKAAIKYGIAEEELDKFTNIWRDKHPCGYFTGYSSWISEH